MRRSELWQLIGCLAYTLAGLATFIFLCAFDGYPYNGWNWLVAIPINMFLAAIWPIYWLILRPILGS